MVIAKITVKPGEEWTGVNCRNPTCGRTILISRIEPEMLDENGVLTVRLEGRPIPCPHCKSELVYQTSEVRRFRAQQFQ